MAAWQRRIFTTAVIMTLVFLTPSGYGLAGEGLQNQGRRHRVGGFVTSGSSYDGAFDYDFFSLNPFWGVFLTDPARRGSWEFALEGFYNKYTGDYSSNYELGLSPTIRWHYGFEDSWSPYLEASIGVMYTDLDIPETGTDINYDVHVGGGLNFRLKPDLYLSASYRLRHLSNGGMSERNKGVDYNQFVFGLSYYYK